MLFGTTKLMVYIDKGKLIFADYRTAQKAYWEIAYTNGQLAQALEKVIRQFGTHNYKLILNSTVSYTLRLERGTAELPSREQVLSQLRAEIPEDFLEPQFDWKVADTTHLEAIIIAGDTYQALQQIRTLHPDLKFTTQSVDSLLHEMNTPTASEDPTPTLFAYAADKGADHGDDAHVLDVTIAPQRAASSPATPIHAPETTKESSFHFTQTLILLAIIASCLIGSSYLIATYVTRSAPDATPIPTLTPTPTPTPLPRQAADFRILVQNGTQTPGLAGQYQLDLQAAGFTQVETGNAESPSATTTITINAALPDFIQQKLLQILSPRTPSITVISDQTENDIVITIGTQ